MLLFMQNGKLLRSVKSHSVAVICLNWEEDDELGQVTIVFNFNVFNPLLFPAIKFLPNPSDFFT